MPTFDSQKVCVTYGGAIIAGFGENSKVKITVPPTWLGPKMGTDGEGTRSKNNDNSATVEMTLMGSSASNDILNGFHALDKATNAGQLPLLIKDLSGSTVISGLFWIEGLPEADIQREVTERTWVLKSDKAIYGLGGNA